MSNLQYIRGGSVINKRPFGTDLKRLLQRRDIFSLINGKGCGWMDGGCVTLASAFKRWIGPDAETWCFCEGAIPHHVVTRILKKDIFLDGDGLGTCEDLQDKLIRLEHLKGSLVLKRINLLHLPDDALTLWDDVAIAVFENFGERFGAWKHVKTLRPWGVD